jgi:hypothetical protein
MVARIRNTSRSLLALANAITIPKTPTKKKYKPNRFMMFSIVNFDVLLWVKSQRISRMQRDAIPHLNALL